MPFNRIEEQRARGIVIHNVLGSSIAATLSASLARKRPFAAPGFAVQRLLT